MRDFKSVAAFFVGLTWLAAVSAPASAASPITSAFVANVEANVAFLDQSSRIAPAYSTSVGIRDYARGEGGEHVNVAKALDDALLPPIASLNDVTMGRSVAIDVPFSLMSRAGQAANGRAPMANADLEQLKTVSGRAFDDLYWAKQLDALSQIEADYRAYIAQGDDPELVAMARSELPKVVRRLILLSKI